MDTKPPEAFDANTAIKFAGGVPRGAVDRDENAILGDEEGLVALSACGMRTPVTS